MRRSSLLSCAAACCCLLHLGLEARADIINWSFDWTHTPAVAARAGRRIIIRDGRLIEP